MADQERGSFPRCGYGLLGLCCTSCLSGPCRRSPFAEVEEGRSCGENSDWIVAHNLLERICRESLQAMADFRNVLERCSGLDNRGGAPRLEEMKLILSPFSHGGSAWLERLYPEKAFPMIHALKFPSGSWSSTLLDAAAAEAATRSVEAQLEDALRLSAITMAAEVLSGEWTGSPTEASELSLPAAPSPVLLLVSDDGGGPLDGAHDTLLPQIEATCRERVWIGRLRHINQLPALGRRIYDRWGIPASTSGSLVVVASSSMIRGMGALALGFSLVSLPGYPLQGSPRVERYLTHHLQQRFGHAYHVLHSDEGVEEQILRGFMR